MGTDRRVLPILSCRTARRRRKPALDLGPGWRLRRATPIERARKSGFIGSERWKGDSYELAGSTNLLRLPGRHRPADRGKDRDHVGEGEGAERGP